MIARCVISILLEICKASQKSVEGTHCLVVSQVAESRRGQIELHDCCVAKTGDALRKAVRRWQVPVAAMPPARLALA